MLRSLWSRKRKVGKTMKPIEFPQASKTLTRPPGEKYKLVKPLPVYTDEIGCISCWKATWKDRLNILFHGKIWVGVMSGNESQPPISLGSEDPWRG